MSPTLRRHVLPLCVVFGWLWMLLPFHTLGIDGLVLALLPNSHSPVHFPG